MLFKDAITEFTEWRKFKLGVNVTLRGNDKDLRLFCLYLKNPQIEDVTHKDVMGYLNMMVEIGWAPNSFVSKCMALRKFFEFCNLRGFKTIDERLIPVPQKQYKIPRVATEDEFKKLISVAETGRKDLRLVRNMAIMHLLWDTGARNGEIMALDVEDLDLVNHKALIKTEKAKTRRPLREIFWTDKTNEHLLTWMKERDKLSKRIPLRDPNALFLSLYNSGSNHTKGYRFRQSGVCEMLRNYSNKAGLERTLNAHSMRHFMGRNIIEKGGSNSDVTNILGHSCIESSMVYTMMYGTQIEKRYRKFRGK
jgi:site-specific recombinase XerD